jgi:hypothetical protein
MGGFEQSTRVKIRPPRNFFVPVRVLSRVFRGKFVAGLKKLSGKTNFDSSALVNGYPTRRNSLRSHERCFADEIVFREGYCNGTRSPADYF